MRDRLGLLRRTVLLTDQPAALDDPHATVVQRDELACLTRGVAHLSERQRRALVMCAADGRSHDEIAAESGTSPAAVKSLVCRARTALNAQAA